MSGTAPTFPYPHRTLADVGTCSTCPATLARRNKSGFCKPCWATRQRASRDARLATFTCADCPARIKPESTRCLSCAKRYHDRQLAADRVRRVVVAPTPVAAAPRSDYPDAYALDAIRGSEQLLRRQLVAGLHWIKDPARFRAACAGAGLIV